MRGAVVRSVLAHDARGIARDNVAFATVVLSLIGTLAIACAGLARDRLAGWAAWFPFVVAVSLVGGPAGFGFLFGIRMVDEGESGVRKALSVTPVRPRDLLVIRTLIATAWMCVWSPVSVYLMNSTWQVLDVPFSAWVAVIAPLALFTPGFALLIPTFGRDKVSALAVFKALSFVSLIPLALFFVPGEAAYRRIFLLSPTGWTVEAYRAALDSGGSPAPWALGALAYGLALLLVAIHFFERNVYRSYD